MGNSSSKSTKINRDSFIRISRENTRENMKIIIALFSTLFAQKKIWWGKCPEVPLIANFDLDRYGGTWYEVARYPMSFQSDEGHCGVVHYGKIDDTTVSVNNSEIQPAKKGKMKRTFILGEAYQTEPETFPNKIHVGFEFNNKVANFFYNLFSGDGDNYWVMETDYTRYSLVMHCDKKLMYANVYAWIMVRDQSFPTTQAYRNLRAELAERWDLSTEDFIENDFDNGLDCDYDYLEYY